MHTWSHTQGEKITVLYPTHQHPNFMVVKYLTPFQKMMKDDPKLVIRYEPYQKGFPALRETLQLADEIKNGAPLPQIMIFNDFHVMSSIPFLYIDQLIKDTDGCYEVIKRPSVGVHTLQDFKFRHILRILPYKRCLNRMIKKGYYRNNETLGPSTDFERALAGISGSPLFERVNKIKKENAELFGIKN